MREFQEAKKQINTTIASLKQKRSLINEQISQLEKSVLTLHEVHNICVSCDGKGYILNPDLIKGDPYARSSDAEEICKTCGGTGKFSNQE